MKKGPSAEVPQSVTNIECGVTILVNEEEEVKADLKGYKKIRKNPVVMS